MDRLSRRVRFIPSRSSDTDFDAAKSFYGNIFKLHGLRDEIASDRDPKFTSKFWRELMDLCGVKLHIRCYCSYLHDDWADLLPYAESACNSAVSDDLVMSPFEVDLGWFP
jgi:hypothetical protein